jgi:hypothetical protein
MFHSFLILFYTAFLLPHAHVCHDDDGVISLSTLLPVDLYTKSPFVNEPYPFGRIDQGYYRRGDIPRTMEY